MNIDNLLAEIKKETNNDELKELINCIGTLSLTPDAMEKKLIASGKISFAKNNDKKNK